MEGQESQNAINKYKIKQLIKCIDNEFKFEINNDKNSIKFTIKKKNSGSFAVTCIASEDRSIPDNCLMRHHRIISDVCSQVSQKAF